MRLGLLDAVGKLWNAPNTLVGLAWGGVGLLLGGDRPRWANNAVEFTNHPLMKIRGRPGAITLGNVIAYGPGFGPDTPRPEGPGTLADHERQHTYQGQVLGPAYLPLHAIALVWARLRDGDHHGPSNWLERGPQARKPRVWTSLKSRSA